MPTTYVQTEEDQMQGQCVTLGSLGMKTHTAVQVKEVTFSLFLQKFLKSQGETMVGANICKIMAVINTDTKNVHFLLVVL